MERQAKKEQAQGQVSVIRPYDDRRANAVEAEEKVAGTFAAFRYRTPFPHFRGVGLRGLEGYSPRPRKQGLRAWVDQETGCRS